MVNKHIDFPRWRCPLTGRWISEWGCMMCNNPPDENYDTCHKYNSVDTESNTIIPRWNNKGQDRRRLLES